MASSTASTDNPAPHANSENTARSIVLHVLCPSLPPPSRFTFHEFTLSSTVASLKARISESIPSRPHPASQRLIYCGKPITSDESKLQSVLEPVESTEYSIHLVLPPAPTPSTPTSTSFATSTTDTPRAHVQPNPLHAAGQFPTSSGAHNFQTNSSGLRFRGAAPPADGLGEADIGLALRRNIDAIRRQVEQQQRTVSGQPRIEEATTTSSNPLSSQARSSPFPRANPWQRTPDNPSNPLHQVSGQSMFTHSIPVFAGPPNGTASSPMARDAAAAAQLEMFRVRLPVVQAQIALCEDQLSRGNAPGMEHIIRIRTHLFHHLDAQYLNPLSPRDGVVESLLTRVFNVYTRADQIRVTQFRTAQHQNHTANPPMMEPVSAPLHLLTSPDGYQALVASPNGNDTIQASLATLRAAQPHETAPLGHGHPPGLQQNAEAAVLQNAVRQAVLNQHIGNAQNAQLGFARNVRRIWLFIRLYFFCYMFSEPGTWTRILMVCVAVAISLLSETGVPQQLYRMIVAPVRQHFESLVQFGPANPQPEARARAEHNEQGAGANPARNEDGHLRFNLRRIERSAALFLASLIPGVGERHVQVRNAADAAERARGEEERRQEEANQQPQEDSTTNASPGGQDATTENGSQYDTPEHEQAR